MRVEGMINIPNNQNISIIKRQGVIKSEIDVANVLLHLKEKDEQKARNINNNTTNNNLNSYQKSNLIEKPINSNSFSNSFRTSTVSLSSINNERGKHIISYNNNPYRSPSSTVYSSPIISKMDNLDNDIRKIGDNLFLNKEREDYFYRNHNILPPVSYLLETKVVNSPMKDNILPMPDIPSFRSKLSNMSDHMRINSMEMDKDDLLYYKSFSNQPNDFKSSRKSSYSSIRDNDNKKYNIPINQNNTNKIYNSDVNSNINYNKYYSDNKNNNKTSNFFRSNPSPNSDHMYNIHISTPSQPVISLPSPSIKVEQNNSYNQYRNQSYYYSSENSSSSIKYNNNSDNLLSNLDNRINNNFEGNSNNAMKVSVNMDKGITDNMSIKQIVGRNNNETPNGKKKEKESRRFPKYIIHILETSYNTSHYPSNNEKDRLVSETHLTHRQINDWFINKRARSSNNPNRRRCARKLKKAQNDKLI
ncbi:hypothetical protein LY90DRAFT_664623 [Neocallimastix californiae]|uniref:Homeobox domain-containing protein n=1 Tax=Neocallimastix californiae TaxID=1754190 RepID=A0A1Y2F8I0_9FUNG|nr:hypothetical protein LY90DRAFT_664623 [Neocallimastix californiae]|eukprot:ORY80179.1 hypothetical protein LY90DRAFT_664623 [Neocallimastix californiae]